MMINLEYQIIAYHDNKINYYWLTKPELAWPTEQLTDQLLKNTNNLSHTISQRLKERFDLPKINPEQIQFNFPEINASHQFVLPVIIYLTQDQAGDLINQPEQEGKFFNTAQVPGDITPELSHDLKQLTIFLNDDIQAHALKNIHWLLPKTFTAKQLSALLTIITGRVIKRNNVRRDFFNQTKIVGKDRSHAGYPSNLFQYEAKDFKITDKPKLKGPKRI